MRRLLPVLALIVAGCAASSTPTTQTAPPTTSAPPSTTSTTVSQVVQVQSCSSPPVTFSNLCEIVDLLEDWHVDRPVDTVSLAETALAGLAAFDTNATEEPPRTLFCAVPTESFVSLCDELGRRMTESQLPAGQAVEAAVAYMIDAALDPFTYYLPPEQVGQFRFNGIVGGIGVLLDARDAAGSKCAQITAVCQLEVVTVLEENPGFEAGLSEGDVIVTIDGAPTEGLGFASAVALIAGDETGVVTLGLDRDGQMLEIAIERRELLVPTVEYGIPFDRVGYISIPDFEFDIPALLDGAIDEIAGSVDTVVVDLRDNPGGFVDTVVEVSDRFVDGGVVMVSDAPDEFLEYTARPGGALSSQRLIVLVNSGTASAAEVLAGALRDRRGAVVLGTNTFGKDAVQIPFSLRNGGELYVAVARWSTPAGESVGNGGLVPDIPVEWPTGASMEDIVTIALEAAS